MARPSKPSTPTRLTLTDSRSTGTAGSHRLPDVKGLTGTKPTKHFR